MIVSPHREGHLLAIPGQLGEGNFAKLSALPGYFKWQDRNVIFRITGANILFMLNNWPDSEWIGGAEKVRNDFLLEKERGEEIVKLKSNPAIMPDDSDYIYKRQPMDHQRKSFALSRDRTTFALLMEQGTGKTKVVIDTACYLYQKKEIDALIIVAWPNGVHRNWIDYEFPEDMSVPYVAEYWSSNYKSLHRQKAYRKMLMTENKLRCFAFNIEAFTGESARDYLLGILGKLRCMLVIDQSASIKNPQALRTKFLIDKASRLASYRRVLDGAPVAEGADELYSQFKFLDPMIIGHDTWTGFKAEFCEIGYFNEIKGYKNLDELRRRIDGYCYRVLADDCQDLPERIYKLWPFELNKEERRIFDELRRKELTFFDSKVEQKLEENCEFDEVPKDHIEEHRALIKNLRLQQISSGWWPGDEFKNIDNGSPSRLEALLLLLQQLDGKALIFSRFRADLDIIQSTFGKKIAVSYHGGISEDDRAEAKRRFMKDPKTKYFIGQPRSAGIGHTLTAANHVIFYSNDPSLRMREECEKRAHRQGLKHKLIIWDLLARDTQDGKVINSLRQKKELANTIMQDPDNFFLQHE